MWRNLPLWRNPHVRFLAQFALVAASYFYSGKLGLQLASINPSATPVWPPTGIALASVMLFGPAITPAIFVGAFLVNLNTAGSLLTSMGIAAGNTLEATVGGFLVSRFAHGRFAFDRPRDILLFTLFAGLLSPTISATIGLVTLALAGYTPWSNFVPSWITWWLGDVGGALIFTPFVLHWANPGHMRFTPKIVLEIILLLGGIVGVSMLVFRGIFPYPYICIPFLMWAAVQFGRRGAVVGTMTLALIATYFTLNHAGPYAQQITGSINSSLLVLQVFLGVSSITALAVGAVFSERKKALEDLSHSERRFRALIENSVDAVGMINEKAQFTYLGSSSVRVVGYKPEDLLGKNAFAFMHPDDQERTFAIFQKLLKVPGSIQSAEFRYRHKDGTWIWMEGTGMNLMHDPAIGAIVTNFHDITERKMFEENEKLEKAEDEALLASIGDGILATDKNGNIILVNKAFEDMLGWRQEEVLGRSTTSLLALEDEKGATISPEKQPLVLSIKTKRRISTSGYLTRKDKTTFPALIVATPVLLNKKIIGGIQVFHDITKEKEIEKAKTEFVSLASHQLRTPLSIMKWYVELLSQKALGQLTDKQKKYLNEVHKASDRMGDLVSALLTTSRLEAGTTRVTRKSVSIERSVQNAIAELNELIKEKGLHVHSSYVGKNAKRLITDEELLGIILQNLISNAVKYTKPGGHIAITVSRHPAAICTIEVKDDGYGIPKDEQSKIFTKMFRGTNTRAVDPAGTGLGLYMVRAIVEKMDGTITFQSQEGKGSTFTVRLPVKPK